MDDRTINSIPTLNLAFIGDGVYDLLVREYLVKNSSAHVGELNKLKVSMVNCKSQAEYVRLLVDELTDEEADIYKRGRNTKVNSASKHSTLSDYHAATGLETLFGWLYLKGRTERINELFSLIIKLST
ncbi:MAG: ribonuclease III [Ruminococcus sp.]|jgi:ribonuclease-3 family protein|nr:ribonuclease III [Ruminococcus sp.]MBQ9471630.1 ribonuclease III [Ruminococcus sp.]